MNFGLHLSTARKAKGMSQEELAERLCVSRQTIYKWEAGITYPDIDKLGDIAKCLDVSTAYLLGEDGDAPAPDENAFEGPAAESAGEEPPRAACAMEKSEVTRHYKRFARMIGACTMLILVSVGVLILLNGFDLPKKTAISVLQLICCIAVAVIGYVVAGVRHDAFEKQMVAAPIFDAQEQKNAQRPFVVRLALGLALIFAGLVFVVVAGLIEREMLNYVAVSAFLALIGVAVYLFITAGICYDLYMGKEGPRKWHGDSKEPWNAVNDVIMLLATAAFLLMGFLWGLWHPGWVVFPIGGILCAIVTTVWKFMRTEK